MREAVERLADAEMEANITEAAWLFGPDAEEEARFAEYRTAVARLRRVERAIERKAGRRVAKSGGRR